ncbi:MAG: glutamate ligase domain-containing protein [Candidatus Paceibacterales bacterium]
MLKQLKYKLYFIVAGYFRFFAAIQLNRWKPQIIVVTGSSGKTTLLHLIESQLKDRARYSHHANSSFGIPFDILGLKRQTLQKGEWVYLFLVAPFKAFKKPFAEKLYIVEADCDRPGEGTFLASLLKPEVCLWLSSSGTHSVNFDELVEEKKFTDVEAAIAYEFGYFLEHTSKLAIINGDNQLIENQTKRSSATIKRITKVELSGYKVFENKTEFGIDQHLYTINFLLPEEVFYSLAAVLELLKFLGIDVDLLFKDFVLPPGRSSVFKGVNGITIVDSSYNATLDGLSAMLNTFSLYPAKIKWAVIGDMLEQGKSEAESHQRLAELLAQAGLDKIILMGPRVCKYTYPKFKNLVADDGRVEKFEMPKQALDYILANAKSGEIILFKGARFLEGVVEHLLLDKNDVNKLCRREKVWEFRRKQWGL